MARTLSRVAAALIAASIASAGASAQAQQLGIPGAPAPNSVTLTIVCPEMFEPQSQSEYTQTRALLACYDRNRASFAHLLSHWRGPIPRNRAE